MPRLAIVGAGMAGLAAAHALRTRHSEIDVVAFEKARGVSGRAATRWADVEHPDGTTRRWRYDHGAQYASPDADGAVADLLRATVGDALVDVPGAVWPFDDDGTLRPDRARPPEGVRWTTADGIAEIGRRIAAATPGLDVRLQTRVTSVARGAGGWTLGVEGEPGAGPFDAVLVTAPGPQAATLLRDGATAPDLANALADVFYRAQFALAWGFDAVLDRPGDVYALVNAAEHGASGGGHDVAWLAVESDKPGRAPEGCTLLLAQMSETWTEAHYDDAPDALHAAARAPIETIWGTLPDPLWTGRQRWRYALPDTALDTAACDAAEADGLFVAGDLTAGKGRVHLALADGLATAARIAARLG